MTCSYIFGQPPAPHINARTYAGIGQLFRGCCLCGPLAARPACIKSQELRTCRAPALQVPLSFAIQCNFCFAARTRVAFQGNVDGLFHVQTLQLQLGHAARRRVRFMLVLGLPSD